MKMDLHPETTTGFSTRGAVIDESCRAPQASAARGTGRQARRSGGKSSGSRRAAGALGSRSGWTVVFAHVPRRLRRRILALARDLDSNRSFVLSSWRSEDRAFDTTFETRRNLRLLMAATLTRTSNYSTCTWVPNLGDTLVHALAYAPQGRHIALTYLCGGIGLVIEPPLR